MHMCGCMRMAKPEHFLKSNFREGISANHKFKKYMCGLDRKFKNYVCGTLVQLRISALGVPACSVPLENIGACMEA
jgi:hypothetical protein